MVDFTFNNPIYLFALISIPLLIFSHFIILRGVLRKALKFANFDAIKRVEGAQGVIGNVRSLSKNLFLLMLRCTTLFFLIFAATGTVMWYVGNTSDFNFVLAIDASGSMLANDLSPNRIEVAKESAITFVDSLPERSNVGVISFAGTSYIEQPVTDDMSKVRESIGMISVKNTHGTSLGSAITTSTNILFDDNKPKVMILLTDGQENVLSQPELLKVIQFAKGEHLKIYAIGIGTQEGANLEILENVKALFTLDESVLKEIADKTGGKYFLASNREDLLSAFQDISSSTEGNIPVDLSFAFIIIALALSFIEWVLINTKFRTIP